MIKSFGVHWHANEVNWGGQGPGNQGTLLGAASKRAKAVPVDFRSQRGVYALYADYDLVYLGQAGAGNDRLFNRLKTHRKDHLSERWNRFSWFGTQWVTQQHRLSSDAAEVHQSVEAALNMLEAVAIAISEPRLNLQRGRWSDTTKYFQYKKSGTPEDEEDDEEN
jgi:hypothetical protein